MHYKIWHSKAKTEESFANEPLSPSSTAGETHFRSLLKTVAKNHIPHGFVCYLLTNLSENARYLVHERDEL